MSCLPKTTLVVRSNYGDESVALVQFLYETRIWEALFSHVVVVYVDTNWSAQHWPERVILGEQHVRACGFESVRLESKMSFSELVLERNNFPSTKFQWCAGFLKGLPLLSWLDEHDAPLEWTIAIAKRQALYRQAIPEYIESCEYHGERKIWHPILNLSCEERDALLLRAGFSPLNHRSLECEPCVNSHAGDLKRMQKSDHDKLEKLEKSVEKPMFLVVKQPSEGRQNFTMGCGDFFGCGL